MTVRELLRRIDAHEFAEWMAYAQIEPFGPLREDLRAGVVATAAVAPHVKRAPTPTDFFPELDPNHGEPILLDDPQEQAKLVARTLFGKE